jgi:hypothetical protein
MSKKQVREKSRQKTSGNFCVFRTFGEEFATSYPGLFASAVGWSAKKALASAGLFCNLIGQ